MEEKASYFLGTRNTDQFMLDAEKKGDIFVPEPKVEPTVPQGDPDQV